jgi:hypothetical protein
MRATRLPISSDPGDEPQADLQIRSLHPEHKRPAIILDNFSPHLTTKTDTRVGDYGLGSSSGR